MKLESGEGEVISTTMKKGKKVVFRAPLEIEKAIVLLPTIPSEVLVDKKAQAARWEEPPTVKQISIKELLHISQVAEKEIQKSAEPERKVAAIPPRTLTITSPPNHAELEGADVAFVGQIPDTTGELRINGELISNKKEGSFNARIPLALGANSILIQWTPHEGDVQIRSWTLFRKN